MPPDRLDALAEAHALPAGAAQRLRVLLELVAASPHALTTVREADRAAEVHVADSLSGLAAPEVSTATAIADLGSGAGFPGLVLAVALPQARVAVVESVGKKAAFLGEASAAMGLENVEVVAARAEAWPEGLGSRDLITARALAPLPALLEYAAPLLREGGSLVAWKGRRDAEEEAAGARAAVQLGMSAPEARRVEAGSGADQRHLVVSTKVAPTPPGFPRRPGMARKRALG